MNYLGEDWTTEQFEISSFSNARKITRNNKSILSELKTPFVTYNSNQEFPCFNYDIVHRNCIN